ncbi:hypothetical protein OKW40_003672 [Paraburkholderia sp. RAU6.4a]
MLKGKLPENELLVQQVASNSDEQYASSPDLEGALMHAIIDAFDAHATMNRQALDSSTCATDQKTYCGDLLNSMRRCELVLVPLRA